MKLIREGRAREMKDINVFKLYNEHTKYRVANGVVRDEYGTKELLSWLTTYVGWFGGILNFFSSYLF